MCSVPGHGRVLAKIPQKYTPEVKGQIVRGARGRGLVKRIGEKPLPGDDFWAAPLNR